MSMEKTDPCAEILANSPTRSSQKSSTRKSAVVEPMPPEPFFTRFPDVANYDNMWYDDPIEGEEAIAAAHALQQKIELKAAPIQLWLVKNIVPLLIQALNALVAKRPDTIKLQCEFVADHLMKYNPLKDTYPDEYLPKPKPMTIPSDEFDKYGLSTYNPCDCNPKDNPKDDPAKDAPPTAIQMAKKETIASDAMKNPTAHDALRASVLAQAKSGSVKY